MKTTKEILEALQAFPEFSKYDPWSDRVYFAHKVEEMPVPSKSYYIGFGGALKMRYTGSRSSDLIPIGPVRWKWDPHFGVFSTFGLPIQTSSLSKISAENQESVRIWYATFIDRLRQVIPTVKLKDAGAY